MRPFQFTRADDARAALLAHASDYREADSDRATSYLAGGTTLIDLMKLDVMRPSRVIDITALREDYGKIVVQPEGLYLGAMAHMSEAADHPGVRQNYPVLAQSLQLAASAQIRNMASLSGNVLQRTRCSYFRDVSYSNCNKRNPGSGCAALGGINRAHAVLGASDQCIATYPGDFAQALLALDARVELAGPTGRRVISFADLHQMPGATPHVETTLRDGELITAFRVPAALFARRSVFLKIRDRESYEFALTSAAVALDLNGDTIREARIALGGVATVPWRAHDAEARLTGQPFSEAVVADAAAAAFADAKPHEHNAFKIELGKRTLARALHQAAALEI